MNAIEQKIAIFTNAMNYEITDYHMGDMTIIPKDDPYLYCEVENYRPTYRITVPEGCKTTYINVESLNRLVWFVDLLLRGAE